MVAGLVSTVAADALSVYSRCPPGVGADCPERTGIWWTNFGNHITDARGGCKNPGVPGINNLCIDWPGGRGHFDADNQPRRCIQQEGARAIPGGHCTKGDTCYMDSFKEVPCTW
ncbi:hypothetical protein MFIFM68171_08393 [Madurella fahalii]|uniref:Secreted protein n=1 Tax=Madurella fahalii TaxID=1157608 RepID=A0ABQ0GKA6_9PEZI